MSKKSILWPFVVAFVVLSGCSKSDSSESASTQAGMELYRQYCTSCHQPNGEGVPGMYPTLVATEWVQGDKGRLIRLVLNGVQGQMEVKGETYNNIMTAQGFLEDEQIASLLTFVRTNLGNKADAVTADEVRRVRAGNAQQGAWNADSLWKATGIPAQ